MKTVGAALSIIALILAGCANTPPLGRSLPANFAEASAEYNRRVVAAYPVGSQAAQLLADLNRQHFKVTPIGDPKQPYQFMAVREGNWHVACDLEWDVYWSAADGWITAVGAARGTACL